MTAAVLLHRTAGTGHERLWPRSEVEPLIVEQLRPVVAEALKSARPLHVGAGFWVRAAEEAGRLQADIWHGEAQGSPLVRMRVAPAAGRDGVPLLEVWLAGVADPGVSVAAEAVAALGELGRCLAWAWLASFR